jgi:hypothetical protein
VLIEFGFRFRRDEVLWLMTADLQQLSLSPSRRTPVQKMHMAIEGGAVSTM